MEVQDIVAGLKEKLASSDGYDYITMIESQTALERVVSLIYGVLCVVIYILVPVIVAIEVMYLAFPQVRDGLERLAVKWESRAASSKALELTLRDAREARERSLTTEYGTSSMLIYLRLKMKSVIVLVLLLVIVLNHLGTIILIITDNVQRILDVISSANIGG